RHCFDQSNKPDPRPSARAHGGRQDERGEHPMDVAERAGMRASRSVSQAYPDDKDLDLRSLLKVLQGLRDGDFSMRLPGDKTGLSGKVADVINEIAATNERLAREIERAGQLVGKEGRTRH